MGVQGFQEYIEKHCASAVVPVELQKLARGSLVGGGRNRPPQSPLRLLVDAENCLHRLYGGFYNDWVSGGQWNHMLSYLASLSKACFSGNIELVVFFNGALEKPRLHEWVKKQINDRQTAQQIMSHVQNKGTPPPKVWFLPPVCMSHCIRLALLRFRVKVAQSIEDHHQEVIAFCRENGFHGLLAYDSDYALCNIQYYFSAHALKLSRNGKSLTTNQYLMHEVAKQLDLNPSRFVIFAALLGNHILPDEDLAAFHWSLLGPDHPLASLKVRAHQLVLPPCDVVIKAVAEYVRNVQDIGDLDAVARDVFKRSRSRTEDKIEQFKRAVEYYSIASKPPLFQHGPTPFPGMRLNQFGVPAVIPHYPHPQMLNIPQPHLQAKTMGQPLAGQAATSGPGTSDLYSINKDQPSSLSTYQPALPDPSLTLESNNNYSNIPHEGKHTPLYERSSPNISTASAVSPNHCGIEAPFFPASSTSSSSDNEENRGATNHVAELHHQVGHVLAWEKSGNQSEALEKTSGGGHQKGVCIRNETKQVDDPTGNPGSQVDAKVSSASAGSRLSQINTEQIPSLLSVPTRNHMDITTPPVPMVAPEVLRVAEHRHRKGLMYPYVFQVLTKGEIKISISIEDEANKDLPPAALLYRPIRQCVYGVLFSLAEARKKAERLALRKNRFPTEIPPVLVKEWAAYKGKSPQTPELVEALAFREWTCPNLKKLWLGKAVEDKNRRMRAFLACMRSDTPAMLNPSNVPTHLLVLCCVLRYLLQWPGVRILRRHELDAFLAQALSPKLYEPDQLQELKIENLDPRGIQLGALFMSGVDMALFANDACGQPIPWEHCCPWMYFDGKLFQSKLIKVSREKVPLIDLCDGQADQAAKLEKMRQSILEGLNLSRQAHPLAYPPPAAMHFYPAAVYPRPVGPILTHHGRGRGLGGVQPMPSQGGKLEIAGTVVGQWAGSKRGRGRTAFPLQVVSVGGPARGRARGIISSPAASRFSRGAKYYTKSAAVWNIRNQGGQPAYAASAEEIAQELKASGDSGDRGSEEHEKSQTGLAEDSSDSSPAENGVSDESKLVSELNGNKGDIRASNQTESALNNDSKMCNTTPHLNALTTDGSCNRDENLGTAVLKKEE
ncbi:constitutive coactivator of PPAR-gamma-like protein 1 homolog isoform X1 [Carcharodon carcharias]|uniref:constitutive coactivator of PPAR-gamma-like protein 1 homolog isoform X1 n=1 Tax=Carcharodon carcharias TaxID=13397 RepID=UPI001B7E102D|nr:constitutive coactivator of PPAR-gamma-like protein 1 homolog isoform X1 [Carcharodon carcharias]